MEILFQQVKKQQQDLTTLASALACIIDAVLQDNANVKDICREKYRMLISANLIKYVEDK